MGGAGRPDPRRQGWVVAVDTNLLVYAHRRDSSWHTRAHACVRDLAEGLQPWAIPWPCVHEFVAIVTHPLIFDPPSTLERALDQVHAWLESPSVVLIGSGDGYEEHLGAVATRGRAAGARIHDAAIAALCRYHGVRELWTVDRDFLRFPDLATRNPLVGRG